MPELEITLEYSGPDVEDGTMAVEDIVPVLQGFAGAYGKVASAKGIAAQHKLRLVAIRPGSARLILDVWDMIGKNAAALQAVGEVVGASMAILAIILTVIKLKKHVKGEPYSTNVSGQTGLINIVNSEQVSLAVTLEDFNIFKNKLIEPDLSRVVRPLEQGRIDGSTITVTGSAHPDMQESITAAERSIFETTDISVTTTKETWVNGQINSMTKSTNSGYIYLSDGSRVHFKIKSENPSAYYSMFGHSGLVKVRCIAHMDENLRPTELEIFEMTPLQTAIIFPDQESNSPNPQT